ncbi:MAG: hypothetical protein AAGH74_02960 [Pseudomonadota bacterium]
MNATTWSLFEGHRMLGENLEKWVQDSDLPWIYLGGAIAAVAALLLIRRR